MQVNFSSSRKFALQLDAQDKLASSREAFIISDPDLIYFDGNSLGLIPKVAVNRAKQIVEEEWARWKVNSTSEVDNIEWPRLFAAILVDY